MRIARLLSTLTAATIVAASFSTVAQAQFTVGDALVDRARYDDFRNFVVVLPHRFESGAYGQAVTGVSIFNGRVTGSFTPLLVESEGNNFWKVIGAGAQRTVAAGGLQSYAFDLAFGSNIVTANTFVAFFDSGLLSAIKWDSDSDGKRFAFSSNGAGTAKVGSTFEQLGTDDRKYSIQFSTGATSVVPEPATVLLTASGLLVFGAIARKRRNA
jgi:hypothetical protein